MNRRLWFDWHSWAGFKLWILLSFVLVTGAFATISPEIDWLFNSEMRNTQPAPQSLDWGRMLDNARRVYPDAEIDALHAPIASYINPQAIAFSSSDDRFRIFFNPVTAEVVGSGRWFNWQRFFRQTHRHLMMPVEIGVTIVGLLAVPLLISLITSFVIYKRWWRGFGKLPRRSASNRAKNPAKASRSYWGGVHRWFGLWSLWFIPLIAITGLWYLVEQWGLKAGYEPVKKVAIPVDAISGEHLNAVVARSRIHNPNFRIKRILLPQQNSGAVLLQGQAEAVLVRPRANQLAYEWATGDLIEQRIGENLGLHHRISEAADPLHFGTFGGSVTRYIWFVFGIVLSVLSISGVYLYGLRIMRSLSEMPAQLPSSSWRIGWQKLEHSAKWPESIVVVTALIAAIIYFVAG